MTQRIFVYGTLKRGCSNAHYMTGQRFVAEATTEPLYRMVNCGGFPGLIDAEVGQGLSIQGELWDIDETGRTRLDILEDVGVGMYELRPIEIAQNVDNKHISSYFYAWSVNGLLDAGICWDEICNLLKGPR